MHYQQVLKTLLFASSFQASAAYPAPPITELAVHIVPASLAFLLPIY